MEFEELITLHKETGVRPMLRDMQKDLIEKRRAWESTHKIVSKRLWASEGPAVKELIKELENLMGRKP